jgi:hypothetical protein
MVATGLPVIASPMKPLEFLNPVVQIAPNDNQFIHLITEISREKSQTLQHLSQFELERFSYEKEIPRVFAMILNLLENWRSGTHPRPRVHLSLLEVVGDTWNVVLRNQLRVTLQNVYRSIFR